MNTQRISYTIDEVRKILLTKNIKQTSIKLGRTYAAVNTIRQNFRDWLKDIDIHNEKMRLMYIELKGEGIVLESPTRGRRLGSKNSQVSAEEILGTPESIDRSRDAFTDFDILLTMFNKQIRSLVYQMAEDVYADHIKREYQRLEKKSFDAKTVKMVRKNISKGEIV